MPNFGEGFGTEPEGRSEKSFCPNRDLNPGYWLERPASLTGLDDWGYITKAAFQLKSLTIFLSVQGC